MNLNSTMINVRCRQRYLLSKFATSLVAILGAAIALGLGGLLLLIAILIPKSSMIEIAWALVYGVIACYGVGGWLFLTAMDRAQSLAYCPPVIDHSPLSPASDLLLRGSGLKYSPSSELVRPAAGTSDNDLNEELLRPQSPSSASIKESAKSAMPYTSDAQRLPEHGVE